MGKITLDEAGELRAGLFYQFDVPFGDEPTRPGRDDSWVFSPTNPPTHQLARDGKRFCWVECLVERVNIVDLAATRCPLGADHVQQEWWKEIFADAAGGSTICDFVPDSSGIIVVVSRPFGEQLRTSGLRGLDLVPLRIKVNQSGIVDPDVLILQFRGRNCIRPSIVRHGKNQCPLCGKAPLICAECGYEYMQCPTCQANGSTDVQTHRGADDLRLVRSPWPKAGWILEGRKWDGSDFLRCGGYNFVSRRAIDWLLARHAGPFCGLPARVCIDGMPQDRRQELLAMTAQVDR